MNYTIGAVELPAGVGNDVFLCSSCLIGAMVAMVFFTYTTTTGNKKKSVPYASCGFFETVRESCGKNAPEFLLRLALEAQKIGRTCYRLPLPISGGLYIVGDASLQRKIFTDNTTDKSPQMYQPFNAITGSSESIFTSQNNSHWKLIRKCTAPAFSTLHVARMKAIALNHAKEWCNSVIKKDSFDPSHEMVILTFKVIFEAAFEYKASNIECEEFLEDLERTFGEFLFKQASNPLRGLLFGMFNSEVRMAYKSCSRMQSFAAKVLTSYRENPTKSKDSTLIKLIVENEALSDRQRIAEIVIYLMSNDTTGYTMASTLVLLATHPEKASKLRSDVSGLSLEQWGKSSQYFQHVLKESMRIIPVAATGSIRLLGRDFDAGNGEILPKGGTVMMPQIIPYRNAEAFPDPDSFNPDRWYHATDEMKKMCMSFAVGTRNCVGQSFAFAQLESILPAVLSRFEVKLVKKGEAECFGTWKYIGYALQLKEI